MCGIVLHILHACLFVGSKQYFNIISERYIQLSESLLDIQTRDRTGLVISGTSAEQISVLDQRFIGLCYRPVITCRHNIQMRKNTDILLFLQIILDTADIVFIVMGAEAFLFTFFQHGIQYIPAALTKRLDLGIIICNTLNTADCNQIVDDIFLMIINVLT